MEQDRKISAFVKKIRGILFGQVVIDTLLVFLAVGFAGCLVLSVISMLVPFYYVFIYMAVFMALALVAGIIWAFFHKPSMETAALTADSKGCKEKITTAYELCGRDDAFSKLQKTDAEKTIESYSVKENFRFSFKPKRWILFVCLAALFTASIFVETDARAEASYRHDISEKVKEEISEIEKIEKTISENESISEEEAADVLEELSNTKKELLEAEDYDDIKKAWDREKLKLADFASSESGENEALSDILSNALEENTTRKNEELEELIEETREALADAENGTDGEKQEAADKLSELAATLGNSSLSSAAGAFASSDKTNSDVSNASAALNEALSSMSSTSYASSDSSESSNSSTGSNNSGSENSDSNASSSDSSGSNSSGNDSNGSSSDSNGSSGTGDGSGGNENGSGSGTGGGWNRGSNEGSEGASKTAEDVTIPDGELGSDENLTGTGNDNDSSTYEKSDESLTWSGNKVSYGQVSSEYKTKAYNALESSSYPEAMKDKIKNYFDSLN